ncbi:MAG: ECF transporter S component [Defluviitaleaceae bacterium]|nr:ECF transporter S component [Defluviitaleaceae bacterium]
MRVETKRLTVLAMFSAIAFVLAAFVRVPVVLFLRYDPKDVIITIAGFIFGPLAAFSVTVVVSVIQMFTVSQTGPWGLLMNVITSTAFCCTAAFIYKRNRSIKGATIGLVVAFFVATIVAMLWNYLIVPLYMPGVTRESVTPLLLSAFLPFNLISNGLNAAFTFIIYKHVKKALQAANLLPSRTNEVSTSKVNIGLILVAIFVVVTCILWILVL